MAVFHRRFVLPGTLHAPPGLVFLCYLSHSVKIYHRCNVQPAFLLSLKACSKVHSTLMGSAPIKITALRIALLQPRVSVLEYIYQDLRINTSLLRISQFTKLRTNENKLFSNHGVHAELVEMFVCRFIYANYIHIEVRGGPRTPLPLAYALAQSEMTQIICGCSRD